ncbi:peptidylprolyl isomerase [Sinisalibacter lacisalsi]|uniref:Parvulin-like PPIase n=1 Tax=Sinisalibacter lacisalsi TaxID=1526570 RepID=A0ABQ1QRX1_9RHOB|nr:peptidylprolyl isomerase [Sinisalibacter lacisalsi]GGD41738.1 chaperone SurA [Sinisalibacter lacisalsi]
MMTSTTAQRGGSIFHFDGAGRRLIALVLVAVIGLTLGLAPAQAQSQLRPIVRVDGMVITAFELSERQKFLSLLRAPGDVRALAIDQLINEKIQLREARLAGLVADEEAIKAGMEEFAQRGGLDAEQFLALLGQAGIDASTFRQFVTAGIIWRDFVRAELLPRVSISKAEVAAAAAKAEPEPGLRVLLSEIVLPAGDPASRRASMARAQRLTGLDEDEFTRAATRFSTGGSRNNGGKMKWVDITALPPAAGAAVRGLQPGQTSRIVESGEDLRIYFMRDREEVSGGTPRTVLDYAALLLPGGQSAANIEEVARIRARVTSCDDLYPIARGLPPEQLVREELPESQVPASYRAELDRLDPGEISSRVTTSSGAMAIVMLCARGNELPRSFTEEMIEDQLRNQRVSTMAQAFLDEKRANAFIETLGN